jgi:hypothetical protein
MSEQFQAPQFPVGGPVPQPRKDRKALKYGATAVVALFIGVGIGSSGDGQAKATDAKPAPTKTVTATQTVTAKPDAKPQPKVTVTKTAKPKPAKTEDTASTVGGDGEYLVGQDMAAGTYKTAGSADTELGLPCYWERAKNSSGEFDSIITNGTPKGTARVTVNRGEVFKSQGCKDWVKVS